MFTSKVTFALIVTAFIMCANAGAASPMVSPSSNADYWGKNKMFQRWDRDQEIVAKRTLTAKHFRNEDGTYTAVISVAPVHYLDRNNQWREIRGTNLQLNNAPDYALHGQAEYFQNLIPTMSESDPDSIFRRSPLEWFQDSDAPSDSGFPKDLGPYGERASVEIRPTVAAWWTGSIQDDGGGAYSANDEFMFVSTTNYIVEFRAWVQFDVSSVAGANVTDSLLNLRDHCGEDNGMWADYFHMWGHPSSSANPFPADVWIDIRDGTQYCNDQVWYTMQWTGDVDLGPQADDDIKNAPTYGSYQWFAVGLSSDRPDMWDEGLRAWMYGYDGGVNAPILTVTYTAPCTPPTITSGATGGGTVTEGDPGPVTFTVTATGDPAPTYQWKRDAIDVTDDPGHIAGATTDTLVITNVELSDDGDYTCVATNMCGEDTSDPATLIVLPLGACCHGDGSCTEEGESYCIDTYSGLWLGAGTTCAGQTDCNTNGIPDECDIYGGFSNDCNATGVPDECEVIAGGDFDADGDVGLSDYQAFWECMAGPGEPPAPPEPECVDACLAAFDFDSDSDVDLDDFAAFQVVFTGEG